MVTRYIVKIKFGGHRPHQPRSKPLHRLRVLRTHHLPHPGGGLDQLHGILHLYDYDHEAEDERLDMEVLQNSLLDDARKTFNL